MCDRCSPVSNPALSRRSALLGLTALGGGALLTGCGPGEGRGAASSLIRPQKAEPVPSPAPTEPTDQPEPPSLAELQAEYGQQQPQEWGLETSGVITSFTASGNQAVLTLDACGGPGGGGYDAALIDSLRQAGIAATLFINQRWAQENFGITQELIADPLFEIANHGTEHKPLSVNGQRAYGIPGTESLAQAYAEIMENQQFFQESLGLQLPYFRAGTAYADEVAAQMAQELGTPVVNFSVNGDAGATFTAAEVQAAMRAVVPGDIVIGHFNQPDTQVAAGFAAALEDAAERGIEWRTLGEVL